MKVPSWRRRTFFASSLTLVAIGVFVCVRLYDNRSLLNDTPVYSSITLDPRNFCKVSTLDLYLNEWWMSLNEGGEEAVETAGPTQRRLTADEASKKPFRDLCRLVITRGGKEFPATGWLIGDRTVITSAHVLLKRGKWSTKVRVIPQGSNDGAGEQPSSSFSAVCGYLKNGSSHDYGAIFLTQPVKSFRGDLVNVEALTANHQVRAIQLAGYPSATPTPNWSLVFHADGGGKQTPKFVETPRRISYELGALVGQSGGPIWSTENRNGADRIRVVGIQSWIGGQTDFAARFDRAVLNNLHKWRVNGPTP